jgi:hypothetical protein
MSFISLGFFLLSSFWFWVSLEIIAALLVAVGCSGEWWLHHHPAGRKRKEKDEHHKLESRFIAMVALGVIIELFALGHSIKEGKKLEDKVSLANERAENTESNLAVLSKATLELAHQYDLSTNALAEANARLASIRPLKDRLIDCLNDIDPSIVPSLRAGKTTFQLKFIPEFKYNSFVALLRERGSAAYCSSAEYNPTMTLVGGIGRTEDLTIVLKPELAQ